MVLNWNEVFCIFLSVDNFKTKTKDEGRLFQIKCQLLIDLMTEWLIWIKINAIHLSLNENLFELDANKTILNLDILKIGNFKCYLLDYDYFDLTRPHSNSNKQDLLSFKTRPC